METENQDFIPADDDQENLENKVIKFSINDQRIAEVKEELKDVDAYKDLDGAKKAKTKLTKMRTSLAEAHKEAKADSLAYGRRLDGEKNRLLELIAEIEDPIKEDLDKIKTAEAREEQQRLDKIMEGIEQIQAFALDRHDLTFDQLNERLDTLLNLKVDPDFYAEQTEDAENAKEVAESKLRIAIINESARLEEVAKNEATEKENKELREKLAKSEADQAEKDAAQKVKDDAAAAEKKIIDDAAAAEQKVKDDARQKELDDQAAKNAADQKVIDDENARLAAEQVEKDRVAAEELAAEIAALQAPDVEKLELFADAIDHLINVKPVLQSDAGNEVLLDVVASLIQVAQATRSRAGEL